METAGFIIGIIIVMFSVFLRSKARTDYRNAIAQVAPRSEERKILRSHYIKRVLLNAFIALFGLFIIFLGVWFS